MFLIFGGECYYANGGAKDLTKRAPLFGVRLNLLLAVNYKHKR